MTEINTKDIAGALRSIADAFDNVSGDLSLPGCENVLVSLRGRFRFEPGYDEDLGRGLVQRVSELMGTAWEASEGYVYARKFYGPVVLRVSSDIQQPCSCPDCQGCH